MRLSKRKYIVILGSLMSGLGKGILSSSIGKILQSNGLKVVPIKFDGYLNVDCGTMNPYRHGEVFVLDDGTECDMDFGTYERFLNYNLEGISSITGGKIFKRIIDKERKGDFLGRDVQIVPHLTDELKKWVKDVGEHFGADVVLVEVGGTVGDIENSYFIEAMRQMSFEEHGNMLFIQLTYVNSISKGEQKTKPTQHANRLLASLGIHPHIIITREDEPLTKESKEKINIFCNVPPENVFDDPMLETVYELPLVLEKQGLSSVLCKELGIETRRDGLKEWSAIVDRIKEPKKEINVAIVGKYMRVRDAYASIYEALIHAGAATNSKIIMKHVESSELDDGKIKAADALGGIDAVIVPGGFGARGVEGKIAAIKYCRENRVPYLGLCLGMQLMAVEYARNVCGMENANSTEFDEKTEYPVIYLMPEQEGVKEKGATMRLGAYECVLKEGTMAHKAYGTIKISERHRHRYEANNGLVRQMEDKGLVVSGTSPDKRIIEVVEWKDSFGIGTQAHPELKSRLERPAPLFVALVEAALRKQRKE
jgi:CTP synthase